MTAVQQDIAYGTDVRQRVRWHGLAGPGPVMAVVPGGGWAHIDPDGRFATAATAWGRCRGYHVGVVSHRLLPEAQPLDQAEDVARALALMQRDASSLGGDCSRMVVLAHSAGAHLCALVHVGALQSRVPSMRPWRASVLLDTAALDVPQLMGLPHAPLHDRAFGADPVAWAAMSPSHRLRDACSPVLLAVARGRPVAAAQARHFAQSLRDAGGRADVVIVNLAHHEMADGLTEGGLLDEPVQRFLGALDAGESPSPVSTRPYPTSHR